MPRWLAALVGLLGVAVAALVTFGSLRLVGISATALQSLTVASVLAGAGVLWQYVLQYTGRKVDKWYSRYLWKRRLARSGGLHVDKAVRNAGRS